MICFCIFAHAALVVAAAAVTLTFTACTFAVITFKSVRNEFEYCSRVEVLGLWAVRHCQAEAASQKPHSPV